MHINVVLCLILRKITKSRSRAKIRWLVLIISCYSFKIGFESFNVLTKIKIFTSYFLFEWVQQS